MPKLNVSTAAMSVLALAGLVFAATVVQDRLGKDGPPASPKAKPSPKAPAFPGKGGVATSGPSLADLVKVAQHSPPVGGQTFEMEVPAILRHVRLSPMVANNRITGWCVESMGMAGVLDREKAMRHDDVLMAIDGRSVLGAQEFLDAVRGVRQGQVLSMSIERNGQPMTCQLTVEDPRDRMKAMAAAQKAAQTGGR